LDQGATFVLVTHIDELHQAALKRQIHSLNVSKPLSNRAYQLPERLWHINESGNGVLAWEIVRFLQTNRLIPNEHLKFQLPQTLHDAQHLYGADATDSNQEEWHTQ
jgi:hypothetical protein